MTSPTPAASRRTDDGRAFYRWRLVAVVALIGLLIDNGLWRSWVPMQVLLAHGLDRLGLW